MRKGKRKYLEAEQNGLLVKHVIALDNCSHNFNVPSEKGKDGEEEVEDVDAIEKTDIIDCAVSSPESQIQDDTLEVNIEH